MSRCTRLTRTKPKAATPAAASPAVLPAGRTEGGSGAWSAAVVLFFFGHQSIGSSDVRLKPGMIQGRLSLVRVTKNGRRTTC